MLAQAYRSVAGNGPKEVVALGSLLCDGSVQGSPRLGRGIEILRLELRKIRNLIDVRRHLQVAPECADVGDVHDGRESDLPLNAEIRADDRGDLVIFRHHQGILRSQIAGDAGATGRQGVAVRRKAGDGALAYVGVADHRRLRSEVSHNTRIFAQVVEDSGA